MTASRPVVVILAGPNGAGKSTTAPALLRGVLRVPEFVNADTIARGLSEFNTESVAITAGRVMLARLKELSERRESFAFETTLASRSFAPWLRKLTQGGYDVHLVFLYLSSAELAIERVAERVASGGHAVPASIIRRRYEGGLKNLLGLYRPIVTTWRVFDASGPAPVVVADQLAPNRIRVYDKNTWHLINQRSQP